MATLLNRGLSVYCPIVQTHLIARNHKLPVEFDFWEKMDKSFIDWCEVFMFIRIKGWTNSKGIYQEMQYAEAQDKQIWSAKLTHDTILIQSYSLI
jgi:hypothetical protein